MALDGLNGFYYEGTPTGTPTLNSGTGFDFVPSLREQLQEGLTGKKKANKPKKTSTPKKSSVPRPKVNYNGTVTYGSLTFKNVEEFNKAFPEIKVSKAIASRAKKAIVKPQMSYIFPHADGNLYSEMLKLHQLEMELNELKPGASPVINQPIGQPTGQPIPTANPKPSYQIIPDGPFAGRTGKYVNGELVGIREITVKNGMMGMEEISLEEAGKRFQKPTPQPKPQPTPQPTPQPKPATISFAENIAEATEADAMEALAKEQAQSITPEQRANLFAERQFAQTEADAMEAWLREQAQIPQAARDEAVLAAEEAKIAPKPQAPETPVIIEQPIAPEVQKPAGSTIEFNAEPAPNAPRPNAAEAEGLGRIIAEDAGAEAEGLGRVVAEDADASTKAGKGFLNSIKKLWSTRTGKAGIIAGLGVLAGAAIYSLSTCEGDKKQQLPPVGPEKKSESKTEPKTESKLEPKSEQKSEPKPEPEKPAQPVPPAQPEEPEKSEENQAQQPQFEEISVVKGSSEWKYAELELIAEHLGQAGYRPSNQEITDRMMQIIEREKKALEEAKEDDPEGKNRHSIPTLSEGDMLKVSPELKKLIGEATNELKEAHKDNPNYKVTWTELRAKVQEKLAA